MKSKGHPVVIVAFLALPLVLIGAGLLWLRVEFVTIPSESDMVPLPEVEDAASPDAIAIAGSLPSDRESPSPEPTPLLTATGQVEAGNQDPALAATRTGQFRVSNQTAHPIRVVLRSQEQPVQSETSETYRKPAHWDFAPEEGSVQGLLLSLPEGKLELRKGDILMAFAQDGSRRYWGPYIVGETAIPTWKKQGEEWLLVLRP